MRERFEESERISTLQTLRIFRRAVRYVSPFRGRFAVKVLLSLASLTPFLVLPWPVKILIDHVIEGIPISERLAGYPFFLRPLLELMEPMSTGEILIWTVAFQAVLVVLIGAMGTTGRERSDTVHFGDWSLAGTAKLESQPCLGLLWSEDGRLHATFALFDLANGHGLRGIIHAAGTVISWELALQEHHRVMGGDNVVTLSARRRR